MSIHVEIVDNEKFYPMSKDMLVLEHEDKISFSKIHEEPGIPLGKIRYFNFLYYVRETEKRRKKKKRKISYIFFNGCTNT